MSLKLLAISVGAVLASIVMAGAATPEPPVGAASCSGCHPAKHGVETPVPALSGRKAEQVLGQMRAFRSGQLSATVMDRIARGYSDAEVEAIATWYETQH